jgi:hypothetical protein
MVNLSKSLPQNTRFHLDELLKCHILLDPIEAGATALTLALTDEIFHVLKTDVNHVRHMIAIIRQAGFRRYFSTEEKGQNILYYSIKTAKL